MIWNIALTSSASVSPKLSVCAPGPVDGVPAHVYQGLRDQLQRRLVSVAEERDRLGSEVQMLQQTVADHENTIIGLQQENSWAEMGK